MEDTKRKKRTHFIHKILEDKFGGKWTKHKRLPRWYSDDHNFWVYRTGRWDKEKHGTQAVYRRFDTKEIVFESDGSKWRF
jgi:hypothetical protein